MCVPINWGWFEVSAYWPFSLYGKASISFALCSRLDRLLWYAQRTFRLLLFIPIVDVITSGTNVPLCWSWLLSHWTKEILYGQEGTTTFSFISWQKVRLSFISASLIWPCSHASVIATKRGLWCLMRIFLLARKGALSSKIVRHVSVLLVAWAPLSIFRLENPKSNCDPYCEVVLSCLFSFWQFL